MNAESPIAKLIRALGVQFAAAGDRYTDERTGETYESVGPEATPEFRAWQQSPAAEWPRDATGQPVEYPPTDWITMMPAPGRATIMRGGPANGMERPEHWRKLRPGFPTS